MVHVGSDDSNPPGTHDALKFDIGGEYWIGFSIYIPDDLVIDVAGLGDILVQWQATPDEGEDYRSPVLVISVDADEWLIVSRWDTRAQTPPGNTWTGAEDIYRAPLGSSIGKWTDWVINIKWEYDSSGFVKVWRDGDLIVDRTGPNCSNDQVGPYMEMGVYKSSWKYPPETYPSNTDWRLFYHDELRIAAADASHEDVAP